MGSRTAERTKGYGGRGGEVEVDNDENAWYKNTCPMFFDLSCIKNRCCTSQKSTGSINDCTSLPQHGPGGAGASRSFFLDLLGCKVLENQQGPEKK